MLKKFEYTDIPGWSASRFDKLNLCARQYYYDYYGKFDHDITFKKYTQLKNLTSVPLTKGTITHDVIKEFLTRLLKTEKPVDKTKFFNFARNKTFEYCEQKTFSEVYYKIKDKIDPNEIFTDVKTCLNNFIFSDRYKWITEKAISNKNNWIIEPPGFGETRLNDMKIYCKVDFLFPIDDHLYIIDWKTGKQDNEKHKKQLLGYVCWASYHFDKSSGQIIPIIAYLKPEYKELKMDFSESDINSFADRIKQETQIIYSYCTDIEKNRPKDKKEFSPTSNKKICNYCNYRGVCR